jgi:hypothetical protein
MIIYIIKSIACLLILLLVHRLLFQREAIYKFNRFYLLAAVIGSFLIPLVEIEVPAKAAIAPQQLVQKSDFSAEYQEFPLPEMEGEPAFHAVEVKEKLDWNLILWGIYGLVTLVFLIRFIRNINLLFDKINRNVHVQFRGETLVLLNEQSLPFSFLSYIFVSKDYFESGQMTDSIFAHEQAHVQGRHSWDNLLIEGLLVIFWFHPGLYLARQAIKLNHEFIADSAALQITPLEQYKTFLLAMMLPDQNPGMVSSLNFSLTKKRFEMMKRKTANSTKWIKILLVVPVLGALVYFFSEKVTAQAEKNSESLGLNQSEQFSVDFEISYTSESVEESKDEVLKTYSLHYGNPPFQSLTKAEYYSETKFFIKYPDGEKEGFSYDQLPEKYARDLPKPPGLMKKNMPSSALFESWKNGDEFAIWIDGKVVPNSTLDEMKVSEIAHYSSSYVYPNARSERFTQKNQVNIYTFSGFENVYGANSSFGKKPIGGSVTFSSENPKNPQITLNSYPVSLYQDDYVQYLEVLNSGSSFKEKSKLEQVQLIKLFNDLSDKYYSLRTEDKPKVQAPVNPHLLYDRIEKGGEITYVLKDQISEQEKSPFSKVSQISSLNNYYIVTASIYQKQATEFQLKISKAGRFTSPSEEEISVLRTKFQELEMTYFNLTNEERRKVTRVGFPYAKIEKDGQIRYKKFELLTAEERQTIGC